MLFSVPQEFVRGEGKDRRPGNERSDGQTAESPMSKTISWATCPCCGIVIEEAERTRTESLSCGNCRFEWFALQAEPISDLVLRHREAVGIDAMNRAFNRAAADELLSACRLALSFIREGSPSAHSCPRCAAWFHAGTVGPCFCVCHLVEAAVSKAEGGWPVLAGDKQTARPQETARSS
jgi:hypothetical protein